MDSMGGTAAGAAGGGRRGSVGQRGPTGGVRRRHHHPHPGERRRRGTARSVAPEAGLRGAGQRHLQQLQLRQRTPEQQVRLAGAAAPASSGRSHHPAHRHGRPQDPAHTGPCTSRAAGGGGAHGRPGVRRDPGRYRRSSTLCPAAGEADGAALLPGASGERRTHRPGARWRRAGGTAGQGAPLRDGAQRPALSGGGTPVRPVSSAQRQAADSLGGIPRPGEGARAAAAAAVPRSLLRRLIQGSLRRPLLRRFSLRWAHRAGGGAQPFQDSGGAAAAQGLQGAALAAGARPEALRQLDRCAAHPACRRTGDPHPGDPRHRAGGLPASGAADGGDARLPRLSRAVGHQQPGAGRLGGGRDPARLHGGAATRRQAGDTRGAAALVGSAGGPGTRGGAAALGAGRGARRRFGHPAAGIRRCRTGLGHHAAARCDGAPGGRDRPGARCRTLAGLLALGVGPAAGGPGGLAADSQAATCDVFAGSNGSAHAGA